MEIDPKKFRHLLEHLFDSMEKIETDLLAHETAFATVKLFGILPELEAVVEKSKETAVPLVSKKYEEMRQAIFGMIDRAETDQALQKLLATWKPKGPAN